MYSIFTKLDDGEFAFVASRDELQQAVELAVDLNATWPRKYIIRDAAGNDADLEEYPTAQRGPAAVLGEIASPNDESFGVGIQTSVPDIPL